MKFCYVWLLSVIAALVLILGYFLCIKEDTSLKVIIPLSCLILGLSICAVVTSCKANTDGNEEGSKTTTVAIMHVTSEEEISSDVKAESVKAYIVMPKEN